MSSFIRCPECGFCYAKYADFIDRARLVMFDKKIYGENSKYKDYDPEKLILCANITPSMKELFDALHIKNVCCRMHLTAKTNLDKYG